ncbi:MAG TPA: hypothetical protein VF519_01630 [Mycobacteriales bacterium]|jgi:hypothetical protein
MRRLVAAALLAGAFAALVPQAQATVPCRYYVIAGRVIRVCPPVG